jgi:hypothetical protein
LSSKNKILRYFKRRKGLKKALARLDTICWYFNHTKKLVNDYKLIKYSWSEADILTIAVEFHLKKSNELRRIDFEFDIHGEVIPEKDRRLSFEF